MFEKMDSTGLNGCFQGLLQVLFDFTQVILKLIHHGCKSSFKISLGSFNFNGAVADLLADHFTLLFVGFNFMG